MRKALEGLHTGDCYHFVSISGPKDDVYACLEGIDVAFVEMRKITEPFFIEQTSTLVYRAVGPTYDANFTRHFSGRFPTITMKGTIYLPGNNTFMFWTCTDGVHSVVHL